MNSGKDNEMRQWNFVDWRCSNSVIFILNSIYLRTNSYTFVIQHNVFIFYMTYCCSNIFIQAFVFFLCSLLSFMKNEFIASIQQILELQRLRFRLSFYQWLFVWIIILFWVSWTITKIKKGFITAKMFTDIFSFIFTY